jgi:hypothetical protein
VRISRHGTAPPMMAAPPCSKSPWAGRPVPSPPTAAPAVAPPNPRSHPQVPDGRHLLSRALAGGALLRRGRPVGVEGPGPCASSRR